jgi:atlastin
MLAASRGIVLSADIRENFVTELRNLVPELLAPENLIVKNIGGQQIKAKDVFNYMKVYIKLFQKGKIAEVKSIFQVY